MNLINFINKTKEYNKWILGFNVLGGLVTIHWVYNRNNADPNEYFIAYISIMAIAIMIFSYFVYDSYKKKDNLILNSIAILFCIWITITMLYIDYYVTLDVLSK